jgi:hypothetical protein
MKLSTFKRLTEAGYSNRRTKRMTAAINKKSERKEIKRKMIAEHHAKLLAGVKQGYEKLVYKGRSVGHTTGVI